MQNIPPKIFKTTNFDRFRYDEFLLKLTLIKTDFKRNLSGRTRRYEYSPPPSPINALVSPLLPTPSLALFCSSVQLHCGRQEKCDIDNASQR